MEIKPIRTKKDHRRALDEISRLWGAPTGSSAGDKLDVLLTLVDAYEQKSIPIDLPDPVEAIIHRLDQMGYTQTDLARMLGSRARASEILHRKRKLTLETIRTLIRELGVPPQTLVREYSLRKQPRKSLPRSSRKVLRAA